jgi:hypothetical protein
VFTATVVTIKHQLLNDFMIRLVTRVGIVLVLLVLWIQPSVIWPTLLTGIFVYSGFLLPLIVGSRQRMQRATESKQKELAQWGFHSLHQSGPWINHIQGPVKIEAALAKGKHFCSEWLVIDDGRIIVNPGHFEMHPDQGVVNYFANRPKVFAWDGCTPKRSFFWLALVGVPDWWQADITLQTLNQQGEWVSKQVFWPRTHYAALFHDAFYQYLHVVPVDKEQIDQLFYDMLVATGTWPPLARFYYWVVRRSDNDVKGSAVEADNQKYSALCFQGY